MTDTMVKEAAQRLLDRREITPGDYEAIEKMAKKISGIGIAGLKEFLSRIGKPQSMGSRMLSSIKKVKFDPGFKFTGTLSGKKGGSNIGFSLDPKFSAKPKESLASRLKGIAMVPAAIGVAGLIGKEAIIDPLAREVKMKRSYNAMVQSVPQLAEKDQDQLRSYFNVVKTFSPKTATNPLVAGHLVNKMIEFGGVDHKLVQDIAAIETGLSSPKITQTILEAGAKAVAGAPKMD